MRKIFPLLLFFFTFFACQKDNNTTTLELRVVDFSSTGKTYIYQNGGDNVACWAPQSVASESIRINGGTYQVSVPSGDASASEVATVGGVETSDEYYAIYPSSLCPDATVGNSTAIELPQNEEYSSFEQGGHRRQLVNAPMAGKASQGALTLRPLEGILACQITGSGWLEYIEIQSASTSLSGSATATITSDVATLDMNTDASNRVKRLINIHTELTDAVQTFYVNLPAFSAQSCNIILGVRQTENGVTYSYKKTLSSASIPQGQIVDYSITCSSAQPTGFASYSNGSEYQPYIISNSSEMSSLNNSSSHFVLANDITYNGTIATFSGTFDGNGNTVTISQPLIATLSGTVKNLITSGSISSTSQYTGSIANQVTGGAIINCKNNADITFASNTTSYVGGICGKANAQSEIKYCTNTGTISSQGTCLGGIVGDARCTILHCVNTGNVVANMDVAGTYLRTVGGIVGVDSGHLLECFNQGTITDSRPTPTSSDYFGGIAGKVSASARVQITNCYNSGSLIITSSTKSCVGGIAGDILSCDIMNCYSIGNITANMAGGIVDFSESDGIIKNCYFGATITSSSEAIAGIARRNYGTIDHCFSPSQYAFYKAVGAQASCTNCEKLTSATTIEGGGSLVDALNSGRSEITGAYSWSVQNGVVVLNLE